MAKRNVTAAATAPLAPLSTKLENLKMPCALRYFWAYASLAWGYCRANLPKFAAESSRFTETFVDDQLNYIATVKTLPNNSARTSMSSEVRLSLEATRQVVLNKARRLGIAIDYAYQATPSVAPLQRKEAGLDDLFAATTADWGAVSTFITSANTYLKAYLDILVKAGAINADFATNFESEGLAFNSVWKNFVAKRKDANLGTEAVVDGIEKIQSELDPMLELGKEIFKYDPITRKLFTTVDLVAEVRGGHQAGIKGKTDWAVTEKPIAGVLAEVLEVEGKSALTDAKGRYEIKIAAGEYMVRFTSKAVQSLEQKVLVMAGVTRRLNVLLEPAPALAEKLAVPPPVLAATPPAADNLPKPLTETRQEVEATNGVHLGVE